jgi:S-layer homology domain
MKRLLSLGAASLVAFLASVSARAQEVDPGTGLVSAGGRDARAATPQAFGTSALTLYQVSPGGCLPDSSSVNYDVLRGYRFANSGDGHWDCPLNLPAGAKLDSFEVLVHDENALALEAVLQICDSLSVDDTCFEDGLVSSTGTPSEPFTGFLTSDVSGPGYEVDKLNKTYSVRIFLPAVSTTLMFRQVNVYYRQQVSPAPAVSSFGDVPPSHPFFRFIEAFAAAGITSGCGGGNFCPERNVTRGEMAVFLARALGLHFPN